jgi:dTDP-4-amino-4,6-dideoxygalactose transaminase
MLKLPITEQIHSEVLSLPMDPTLSKDEIAKIVVTVTNFQILG